MNIVIFPPVRLIPHAPLIRQARLMFVEFRHVWNFRRLVDMRLFRVMKATEQLLIMRLIVENGEIQNMITKVTILIIL